MASLDWQDRRRIELSSRGGVTFDDPTHAALAAERAHRSSVGLYWTLLSGPVAMVLVWLGLSAGPPVLLWFGLFLALLFAFAVWTIVVRQRARVRHLATADFDALREIALKHRTTYRRRY